MMLISNFLEVGVYTRTDACKVRLNNSDDFYEIIFLGVCRRIAIFLQIKAFLGNQAQPYT